MSSNFLEELNKAQRDAVEFIDGPSLVIAGAGSGKTRVLTFKIAHLLNSGFKPYQILALTFTNKAAKEMKERIAKLIGENAMQLWMGTFHSIFAKILRREAEAINFTSNFTIYDATDSKSLIKTIIKELHLDDKIYGVSEVYGRISKAKNNLVTADVYASNPNYQNTDIAVNRPLIYRIYQMYANRCKKANAMDFDDLLLFTNILFRDRPDILEKYQKQIKFVLVDEYQDTNLSQYLIVKKLAEKHNRVCVVGDDAQSIYAFRGARIENILNFQKDYPNNRLFKLEQNYRSTQNIVEAANSIIAKNEKQIRKEVFSKNENGSRIKIVEAGTDSEEGFIIINQILDQHLTEHDDYKDFAILYRTNAQSRIFEEALRKRNIPYKIYGGTSFYQRKEIKDLLAYFRLIVNKNDDEALKRIINYPRRGIGDTTIEKIEQYANENDIRIWEIISNLQQHIKLFNSRAINPLISFVSLIQEFTSLIETTDAYNLAGLVASKTGILKDLHNDKTPEGVSRYENIQELLNGIKEQTDEHQKNKNQELTMSEYLQDVSLMTTEDNEKPEERNKVSLMTIHASKGLEFKNVYVVGIEEGLFPSSLSAMSQIDLEEERRLFYVAITRAEKRVTLSYSNLRHKWGQINKTTPSRFITEIDEKFIEFPLGKSMDLNEFDLFNNEDCNLFPDYKQKINHKKVIRIEPFEKKATQPVFPEKKIIKINNESSSDDSEFIDVSGMVKNGQNVEHQRFGFGKIINLEGNHPNIKATIEFNRVGTKNLLLKFAKLKIIQ